MKQACRVIDLNSTQDQKRTAGQANINQRLLKTSAEAAYTRQMHVHASPRKQIGESVINAFGAIAAAARSHADADARNGGHQLGKPRFPDGVEGSDILNWRHHLLSRSSALTCRCSVCSFTWPQMLWLISTTGASAHCPKHATVRTVNLLVRGRERQLIGFIGFARLIWLPHVKLKPQAIQQVTRTARVAGGATTDADGVVALWLQVEQRIEGGNAEYL